MPRVTAITKDADGNVTGTIEKTGCLEGCGCGAMLVTLAALLVLGVLLAPSVNGWPLGAQVASYAVEGAVAAALVVWWRRSEGMRARVSRLRKGATRLWRQ
ncbi:MAG: hypothetical protein WBU92_01420 [Candidatus Dormiibacterota bacterium]